MDLTNETAMAREMAATVGSLPIIMTRRKLAASISAMMAGALGSGD